MAAYVFQFAATIPASTPIASPVTVPIDIDGYNLESLDLEVPAGPNGLMGFYVANNGVQWIPQTAGQFIVWNDKSDSWAFEDQPNAAGWAIVGYNTGTFQHVVTTRWHVNSAVGATAPATPPTLTIVTSAAPAQPVVTL